MNWMNFPNLIFNSLSVSVRTFLLRTSPEIFPYVVWNWNFTDVNEDVDGWFRCVTDVLRVITQIYALSEHPVHELNLHALMC